MACTVGSWHLRDKQPAEAEPYLQRCLELASEIGSDLGMASAMDLLGLVRSSNHDVAGARQFHQQALVRYRKIGDRRGEASALVHLGTLMRDSGDADSALAFYQEALAVSDPENPDTMARLLNYVARAQLQAGQVATGVHTYRRALEYAVQAGDPQLLAETRHNLSLFASP